MRLVGRPASEQGMGLIEVVVATGVVSIAVLGLASALSLGIGAVRLSKQRSAASALGTERIERLRNLGYDQVSLDPNGESVTYNPNANHPDNAVWTDNQHYAVEPGACVSDPRPKDGCEALVAPTGTLRHVEDPVDLGTTRLCVYQYVTWVKDDSVVMDPAFPDRDYKRATVVVTWIRIRQSGIDHCLAATAGAANRITTSTLIHKGTLSFPGATPTPTPSTTPAPTSTPAPTPSPTPAPACSTNNSKPTNRSIEIVAGSAAETGYTNSRTVQVNLKADSVCTPLTAELANGAAGGDFTYVATLTSGVTGTVTWTLPQGDGAKVVRVRFRNGNGRPTNTPASCDDQTQDETVNAGKWCDTITLDQTRPTVPGSFQQAANGCTISGTNRTVVFTWTASTDTNLSGYRLYRSIDGGQFTAVTTVASTSLSVSDTASKSYDSVRYRVRAFDKAGNESHDTTSVTYAKNTGSTC